MENNQVNVLGRITSEFKYSHESFREKFYMVNVSVDRTSGNQDILPVMVSDRIINVNEDYIGKYLFVNGEFRSHNEFDGDKKRLMLYIFALSAYITEDTTPINDIRLIGFVCKKPTYRETPLGRKISDVTLAINRRYGKSDYIPCISWGRNALFISNLNTGEQIEVKGRLQSRTYQKDNTERTAYELSIRLANVV